MYQLNETANLYQLPQGSPPNWSSRRMRRNGERSYQSTDTSSWYLHPNMSTAAIN